MRRLHDDFDDEVVSDVLRSLRVRSTVYCRSELSAPWGFEVPARDVSAFHLVTAGECVLSIDGVDEPIRLGTGDLVVLMSGRGHTMRDDGASPVEWLDEIVARRAPVNGTLQHGGGGPLTGLLCGGFMVEGSRANPLVLGLPPVLRLEADDPSIAAWLEPVLTLLRVEVAAPRPGTDAVLASLADLLVTHAIRTYLVALEHADGTRVGALRDRRIAKAVHLAHADPGHAWTVEELATEVAMSRSAFAAKFRQLTGEAPMRYVTRCRLARAAAYLAEDGMNLFDIALRVGYDSEASFTRAFTRTFSMAPGAYRRSLREPIAPPSNA